MATFNLPDILSKRPTGGILATRSGPVRHGWEDSEFTKQIEANRQSGASGLITPEPETITDHIILVDIDHKLGLNRGGRFYDRITLPTIPKELGYDPDPQWATIASLGRNAPFYHYTGSEDTLSFQIDWYSRRDDRRDVLYACRWVEALSKANGYQESPHRIMIIWGKDDKLFQNDLWIVHKASYKLSEFQKHRSMLPQQAYQEIVLKKVLTDNSNMAGIFGSAFTFQEV